MNKIPFSLERALKGDKVVTRDGRDVTDLKLSNNDVYPVVAYIENGRRIFTKQGIWSIRDKSPQDLFMAEPLQVQEEPEKPCDYCGRPKCVHGDNTHKFIEPATELMDGIENKEVKENEFLKMLREEMLQATMNWNDCNHARNMAAIKQDECKKRLEEYLKHHS